LGDKKSKSLLKQIFTDIVRLRVGEALLFSPSAVTGLQADEQKVQKLERLGRIFEDPGASEIDNGWRKEYHG
jgi:hypothetical protein